MSDPTTYFAIWSAIVMGMAIGFGLSHLMRLGGIGTLVMVIALLGMAYATPRFGPMMLVAETASESTP